MSYWKRVHQLVPEHVAGVGQRAGGGHHDPPPQSLRDAARPLADPRHHVRLPEVRRAGVEHQRLAVLHLVLEDRGEPRVPALRQAGRQLRRRLLLGVVVDVEVLGLEDLEVEVPVLDLVLAEVLGARGSGEPGGRNEARRAAALACIRCSGLGPDSWIETSSGRVSSSKTEAARGRVRCVSTFDSRTPSFGTAHGARRAGRAWARLLAANPALAGLRSSLTGQVLGHVLLIPAAERLTGTRRCPSCGIPAAPPSSLDHNPAGRPVLPRGLGRD